jgi:hypothetical protein
LATVLVIEQIWRLPRWNQMTTPISRLEAR